VSASKPSEQAETGLMSADQAGHLVAPDRPLVVQRVNLPFSPGNTGASRRKPTPACPCRVARVVTSMTERSDQAIALRRRAARMRRIDGPGITAEVLENPFNDRRRLNAGDDAQVPAALPAGLDSETNVAKFYISGREAAARLTNHLKRKGYVFLVRNMHVIKKVAIVDDGGTS
jgi:hypothetical protein